MTSEHVVEHVIVNYVIPAICVFGIICNVLNIVILTRRTMTESPYTYLMGIGVADIALLMLAFIEVVFSKRSTQGLYFWKFYDCYIFFPFANVFANSSVWVTVLMTIERFISVRYPLRAKELCTKTLARRCIIGVFACSTFINIPRFFCMKIVKADEGQYMIRSSDFEMTTFYKAVTWFYIVSIHAIPLTVIGTLNSCLVWALYRAQRHRSELQEPHLHGRTSKLPLQTSREQRRLTITCIVIIVLFLVCIVPSALSNRPVAMLLFGRGQTLIQFTTSTVYRCLRAVTNMLVILNSSLNFIIYCLFSHKFVITLKFLMWKALYRVCGERCLGKSRFRRLANTTATVRTPSLSSFNQVLIYPPPSDTNRQTSKASVVQWDSLEKRNYKSSSRSISTQFGPYGSPMRPGRSKTLSSSSSSSSLPSLLTSEPLLRDECLRQCSSTRHHNAFGIGTDE